MASLPNKRLDAVRRHAEEYRFTHHASEAAHTYAEAMQDIIDILDGKEPSNYLDPEIVAPHHRPEPTPPAPFVDWFAAQRCPNCHGIYCGENCNGL